MLLVGGTQWVPNKSAKIKGMLDSGDWSVEDKQLVRSQPKDVMGGHVGAGAGAGGHIGSSGYNTDFLKEYYNKVGNLGEKIPIYDQLFNRINNMIAGKDILQAKQFKALWNQGLQNLDDEYQKGRESLQNLVGKRGLVGSPAEAELYDKFEEAYLKDKKDLQWSLTNKAADVLTQNIQFGVSSGLGLMNQQAGIAGVPFQAQYGIAQTQLGSDLGLRNAIATGGTFGQKADLSKSQMAQQFEYNKYLQQMQNDAAKEANSGNFLKSLGGFAGNLATFGIADKFGWI